jgi:hypothetical protein
MNSAIAMHKFNFKKSVVAILCMLFFTFEFAHGEDSPSESAPSDKKRRLTNFEWDPMPGAKSYEIEIKPKKGDGKSFLFNVNTTSWNGDLKPGKYTMRLRSKDHRGVPGEWSGAEEFGVKLQAIEPVFPRENSEVKSDDSEIAEVNFKWEESPYAKSYEVVVKDESGKVLSTSTETSNQLSLKLPVAAKYSWTIIGTDEFNEKGQAAAAPAAFTLLGKQLELPRIKEPETPYVRQLTWEKVEQSQKYEFSLKRKDGNSKKWKVIVEGEKNETSLDFLSTYKGGNYQLKITAIGHLRQKSKSHQIIFPVASGDRSEATEEKAKNRKSIDRTKGWYGVASYLITQIQYVAINLDKGSGPSTNAFGGTGRLGAGWFSENTPMGFLGIVDLSGFIIGQKNYTYPSIEAHAIYRIVSGLLGEFRLSGGVYYKEIPEILANVRTGDYSVTQLGATGVHTGGEFWYSMTAQLGLQLNGRVYYPISGKTPTGQPIIPTMSYQFGFLGSYRLNDKATGLVGYAYRKDIINYKSTNTEVESTFTSNQSSVSGSYLNFFLEWDF